MTARELIEQAEEPYRTQMLENADKPVLEVEMSKLRHCLSYLFAWSESPQGYEYWEKYHDELIKKGL